MWVTGTGHGTCTYEIILNNVMNNEIYSSVQVSFLINKHRAQL